MSVSPATVQLTREGRFAEPVTFTISCNYPQFITQWTLVVAQDEHWLVKVFTGTGPPPTTLTWHGELDTGTLEPSLYLYRLFVWDQKQHEDFTPLQSVEVRNGGAVTP
ncbi:MAG: hypothetical protein HY597_06745 [Candidatus Omnitrophica bacterium]|nr:hypothetical protein [Candidatus Omnitrophota bacterium]